MACLRSLIFPILYDAVAPSLPLPQWHSLLKCLADLSLNNHPMSPLGRAWLCHHSDTQLRFQFPKLFGTGLLLPCLSGEPFETGQKSRDTLIGYSWISPTDDPLEPGQW